MFSFSFTHVALVQNRRKVASVCLSVLISLSVCLILSLPSLILSLYVLYSLSLPLTFSYLPASHPAQLKLCPSFSLSLSSFLSFHLYISLWFCFPFRLFMYQFWVCMHFSLSPPPSSLSPPPSLSVFLSPRPNRTKHDTAILIRKNVGLYIVLRLWYHTLFTLENPQVLSIPTRLTGQTKSNTVCLHFKWPSTVLWSRFPPRHTGKRLSWELRHTFRVEDQGKHT